MPTEDPASRVDRQVLDLRLALLDTRLRGEQRAWVEDELQALRLARVGVRAPGQVAYLRRLGIGRGRPLKRGPREWGDKVAPRIRG